MKRPLLLPVLLLIAAPAMAQIPPSTPRGPSGVQLRRLWLENISHQAVVFARAYMTNGRSRALAYSPIEPGEIREIVVPRKDCLAEVVVRLNDGHGVKAAKLDDCRSDQLVVGDRGIKVRSAKTPQLGHGKLLPSKG